MNEEQRQQRDARVAELAAETVAAWERWQGANKSLQTEIRMRINLALDEQAKEIAWAIREEALGKPVQPGDYYSRCAEIAAGFGDDR